MAAERSRREFLQRGLAAGAALVAAPSSKAFAQTVPAGLDDLRRLFPDLERHFLFEYYPWYGGPPDYEHWDYLGRQPPLDLSTRYMPRLGSLRRALRADARAARALDPGRRHRRRGALVVGTRELAGPRGRR